jgi:Protein of unknown function (DUF2867)
MNKSELPIDAHTSRPWRIHDVAQGFRVLDVWALPTPGGADDFARLITSFCSFDAARSSPAVRALFAARWALGRLLRLDDETTSRTGGLRIGLPADLRDSFPAGVATGPFAPLYATHDEAAMEIVNRTVHGLLHLGWVPDGRGGFVGQMAVLVKPNGVLGSAYLAAIAPFRHLVVYPTMLGALGRRWQRGGRVTQIDVPDDVPALSTLPGVDYADCFLVDTGAHPGWNAERWARAVLDEAPPSMRTRLLAGWTALGLKDAKPTDRSVLGWTIRRNSADAILLGRDSRLGMPGELLFVLRPEGLHFATFVHHHTPATRPVWAAAHGTHVRTVLELLERACRDSAAGDVTESAGAG